MINYDNVVVMNSRRNRIGTNQYKIKKHKNVRNHLLLFIALMDVLAFGYIYSLPTALLNPSVGATSVISVVASSSAQLVQKTVELEAPTELEEVISYITHVFEPEGKSVVVRAINCFYSESGLRPNAVGQNKDVHKSKDHGVAQLNDYWHKLTEAEKTDYKANIDKAYKIYKGRGNFSAWYGKLCNN